MPRFRLPAINPAARTFGALFLVEAALPLWVEFRTHDLRFEPRRDLFGVAGGILVTCALVAYPLVGVALGIGMTAVFHFGVLEDTLLPVATISAAVLILMKNRRAKMAVA